VIPSLDFVNSMWIKLGLTSKLSSYPTDLLLNLVKRISNNLAVPQVHTVAEELQLGARYLDVRIAASRLNPNDIALAHLLLSDISFVSVL